MGVQEEKPHKPYTSCEPHEPRERVILHSDLNAFFASVETVLHPEYRDKPIAVCGSTEERHGIVLAKSELAKRAGVKTGMVNARAMDICPGLIIVHPQYEAYEIFSRRVRKIYEDYTDLVEPFGMDECWLDVTGSTKLFGSGEEIAQTIRERVKRETGLTVSVGVSFNKVFAKLASDLKKPDAVTVISREDFKEKLYGLPASALLFVGKHTEEKLNAWGLRTIGDVANADPALLGELLGVNGLHLWEYANGADTSRVCHKDTVIPPKSVSHGMTCAKDLTDRGGVWRVILELCQTVGKKLHTERLCACGVSVSLRFGDLSWQTFRTPSTEDPTQNASVIAGRAMKLFDERFRGPIRVRAVTVGAFSLVPEGQPYQMDLFLDTEAQERMENVDKTVDSLRRRFGNGSIVPAQLLLPISRSEDDAPTEMPNLMPGQMYR